MTRPSPELTVLEERIPGPVRAVLATVGAVVAFLVLKDLGRGLWPLSLGTPLIATIVAGGLFVAGVFLLAGVVGGTTRWTPEPHALRIEHEAGRFHRLARLTGATVAQLWAEESEDSAPRAHVCIHDLNGKTWRSPGFLTLAAAQGYAARLAAHLRVKVSPAP